MKRNTPHRLALILISFIIFGSLLPVLATGGELRKDTYVRAGAFTLTVCFKEGKEAWAKSIIDESPNYIRKVERYMNSSIRWPKYMIIQGCDDCTSRAELQQHTIYLNYQYSTPEDVSVLFHEINHFWFYYNVNKSSEEWLIEGIASFLPNAMRNKKLLKDKPLYHEVIDRYWGLDWPLPNTLKDLPLYPFNEGKRQLVYTKSYRLQYLFYCLLGKEKYQSFVKKISSLRRRSPSRVIAILNQYRKANWKRIISGWVLGDKYRQISLSDFTYDQDSDGLSRAKEYCYRTKAMDYDTDGDLLPDGAEVQLGRKAKRPDSNAYELLKRYGPFVNGSDKDWAPFDSMLFTDVVSDVQGPLWADMQQMSTILRNGYLYVIIKTAARPENSASVFFDVLVDTNNDNMTDEEFAFFLNNPQYPWQYSYSTESSKSIIGLEAASGDYIEMAIPLSAISSQSFRILPIIRDNEAKTNYDSWDQWILVP